MKLFLTTLCATFLVAPLSFASDCKKECDKEKAKEEGTLLVDKCKDKEGCDKDKEEGTLADCGKCKDKDKDEDKEKKEGTVLA